jgi:hypothetical protein
MKYLVAIHHPDDYDPASAEDEAMHRDIDVLNDEMNAAGITIFLGGLHPARSAKSLRARPGGEVIVTDGPYLETKEHIGGFWVLEASDLGEALGWGRKAVAACRAPVEVRQFHGDDAKSESLVASCKKSAMRGMDEFLKALSFVPEDRLEWTPTTSAKSAMRIAAHTALTVGNFAKMIRDRKLPVGDEIPELVARMDRTERALTDRTEMESVFRRNTDEAIAALDTVTPEAAAMILDTSLGWTMPMTVLMNLPGTHAMRHASQIDYLQTCWGDQEVHF